MGQPVEIQRNQSCPSCKSCESWYNLPCIFIHPMPSTTQKPVRLLRRLFWGAMFATLLTTGIWIYALIWGKPWNLTHFSHRVMAETGLSDPEWQTLHGYPWLYYLSAWKFTLTDRRPAAAAKRADLARKQLLILERYNRERLSPAHQAEYDQLHRWLTLRAHQVEITAKNWVIYPEMGEPYRLIRFVTLDQPVRTNDEAEQYLSRLQWLPQALDQVTEASQQQLKAGKYPPKAVVEQVLADIDAWLALAPTSNPLFNAFARHIARADPTALNRIKGMNFLKDAETIVGGEVYPALQRMRDMLEQEALPKALEDFRLPTGNYGYYTELWSGRALNADSLWPLASLQVLPLAADTAMAAPVPEQIRSALVRLEGLNRQAGVWSSGMFDVQAPARPRVTSMEADMGLGVAAYLAPSLSGDRPATMAIAPLPGLLQDSAAQTALTFEWLTPGWHYVWATLRADSTRGWAGRLAEDPVFWQSWGLYAAWLMEEEVKIVSDTATRRALQRRRHLAWGACAADIALHGKGMTWKETLSWLQQQGGFSDKEARILATAACYHPGEGGAVYLGFQALIQALSQAKLAQGDNFYLPDYHRDLIRKAPFPLLSHQP